MENSALPQKELRLFSEGEYFAALTRDINSTCSGDRIGIMSMSFEPAEPIVSGLMKTLQAAAGRGVEVILNVDAYALMVTKGRLKDFIGPIWSPVVQDQEAYFRRLSALDSLAVKPSARYTIVNKPKRNIVHRYKGRSHLKTAVVNDNVYIGGPNLHLTQRSDMVVGLEDSRVADLIYGYTDAIAESGDTKEVFNNSDFAIDIDSTTKLLVDAGVQDKSLTMNSVLEVVDEAERSLSASFQYVPHGKMVQKIAAAYRRGIDIHAFYNSPDHETGLVRVQQRMLEISQHGKLPRDFFANAIPLSRPVIHSKAIANEKRAIVGSHNFEQKFVSYGTAEIAIDRIDPVFASEVGSLLLKQACGLPDEGRLSAQPLASTAY